MDEVSLIVLTVLHTMFGEFPSKALTRRKSRYLFFETGSHQPKPAKLTQVLSSHYPWAVIGSYFVLRSEHSNWVCDTLIGQVPTKKRNLSFVVCALKSPWSRLSDMLAVVWNSRQRACMFAPMVFDRFFVSSRFLTPDNEPTIASGPWIQNLLPTP